MEISFVKQLLDRWWCNRGDSISTFVRPSIPIWYYTRKEQRQPSSILPKLSLWRNIKFTLMSSFKILSNSFSNSCRLQPNMSNSYVSQLLFGACANCLGYMATLLSILDWLKSIRKVNLLSGQIQTSKLIGDNTLSCLTKNQKRFSFKASFQLSINLFEFLWKIRLNLWLLCTIGSTRSRSGKKLWEFRRSSPQIKNFQPKNNICWLSPKSKNKPIFLKVLET